MRTSRPLRGYNALLFDLVLKRQLRVRGQRLQDIVFASRRIFEQRRPSVAAEE